tara:strand:- start:264 stop:449 length:186 start_codon:yes stop_codon:yes gene_type:complete
MANLTEETLQLIYKKLDEILTAINKYRGDADNPEVKPITQKQFNDAMNEVMRLVNNSGRSE